MKKVLLTCAAAMMVAMGANAQRIHSVGNKMQYQPENVKLENVMTKEYSSFVAQKAKTHRAEGTASIEGSYILDAQNFAGDFIESTMFNITAEEGTINLDQYEGAPEFNYNVVLTDFTYTGATVYGNYNEEYGAIEIPVQTIFTHATYKEIVISGGYRSGENNIGYGKELILIDNGDGTMSVDPDAEEEGEQETTGYVNFIPNYVDPETKEEGGLWNYGFDIQMMKPNGTMKYATTSAAFGGTGDGWANAQADVYIADYGSEWAVSNFIGTEQVSISLENDGTCSMELGNIAFDYKQPDPYGYYRFVGITIDGKYLVRNYDKTVFNGFWNEGTMEFFKTEYKDAWTDEEGEHDAGDYYVDDDDDYVRYIAVATANDETGAAYVLGYVCNIIIQKNADDSEGITTVNANSKSTKTFNLMGQQVSRANAKGIVIRDGKKLMVK